MNTISMGTYRPSQKLHPLTLLAQLTSRQASGCLQVSSGAVSWFLYLEQGRLIYASNSVDPFGRLDRHLRRLSVQIPSLVSAVRVQVRLLFDAPVEGQVAENRDYHAICWLVEQQHLSPDRAAELIEALAREVLEAFLLVQTGSYELIEKDQLSGLPKFCQLDLRPLVEDCQHQLRRRQALGRGAPAPAERSAPVRSNSLNQPNLNQGTYAAPEPVQNSPVNSNPAVDSNPDAYSNPPASPDPVTYSNPPANPDPVTYSNPPADSDSVTYSNPPANPDPVTYSNPPANPNPPAYSSPSFPRRVNPVAAPVGKTTYTIACIDDSPTVLQAINAFLDDKSFSVVMISDPVKALMQVIRSKPDLILLDVTMPNLDGYELCSLLRKHPSFRHTPIIMVTGNTGFIDRAKARLVGASGYLTKPFTQSDLIKIVFKHLT